MIEVDLMDIVEGTIKHHGSHLIVPYEGGDVRYISKQEKSEWETVQIHFHSPSEHQINNLTFDTEMHVVLNNKPINDQLLVFGILFELDEKAEDIEFLDSLDIEDMVNTEEKELEEIPLQKFIDSIKDKPKFNYKGSLTSPPCTEIVEWFVLEDPVKINQKQLNDFQVLWEKNPDFASGIGNNRNIQALNRREVILTHQNEPKLSFILAWTFGLLLFVSLVVIMAMCCIKPKKDDDSLLDDQKEEILMKDLNSSRSD